MCIRDRMRTRDKTLAVSKRRGEVSSILQWHERGLKITSAPATYLVAHIPGFWGIVPRSCLHSRINILPPTSYQPAGFNRTYRISRLESFITIVFSVSIDRSSKHLPETIKKKRKSLTISIVELIYRETKQRELDRQFLNTSTRTLQNSLAYFLGVSEQCRCIGAEVSLYCLS